MVPLWVECMHARYYLHNPMGYVGIPLQVVSTLYPIVDHVPLGDYTLPKGVQKGVPKWVPLEIWTPRRSGRAEIWGSRDSGVPRISRISGVLDPFLGGPETPPIT